VTVPPEFVGAWERADLHVEGGVVTDAGCAVWVEAGTAFVDVRGPGGFASDTCFAGTTSWSPPYLTWTHAIDRAAGDDHVDRGRITFDRGDLIEEGDAIAGCALRYRERWRRLGGAVAPVVVQTADNAIAVRVGDHAAAVYDGRTTDGSFAARYWRHDGVAWRCELAVGDDVALRPPVASSSTL
jgi:hypothetical protein